MKCNHCGAEIPDDSMFCEFCGKRIGEENIHTNETDAGLGTKQKIILGLLAAYVVIALIILLAGSYGGGFMLLGTVGAIMLAVAIWQKNDPLKRRPFEIPTPNGEKPAALFSILGIGQHFMGAFKYREYDGTYVIYSFFHLILPLFPTGCYRVKAGKAGLQSQEWFIYGSEKMDSKEILNIYLYIYGVLLWIIPATFGIVFSL